MPTKPKAKRYPRTAAQRAVYNHRMRHYMRKWRAKKRAQLQADQVQP